MRQKQLRKALLLVLLSVSDYKRVYTSSYFIVTTSTRSIKPQVKVSHCRNSPEFTLYVWLIMGNWQNILLWSGSTKSWSRIVFLRSFADLHWRITLSYTSQSWLSWKLLVLLSELRGKLSPLPPWLRAWVYTMRTRLLLQLKIL